MLTRTQVRNPLRVATVATGLACTFAVAAVAYIGINQYTGFGSNSKSMSCTSPPYYLNKYSNQNYQQATFIGLICAAIFTLI